MRAIGRLCWKVVPSGGKGQCDCWEVGLGGKGQSDDRKTALAGGQAARPGSWLARFLEEVREVFRPFRALCGPMFFIPSRVRRPWKTNKCLK